MKAVFIPAEAGDEIGVCAEFKIGCGKGGLLVELYTPGEQEAGQLIYLKDSEIRELMELCDTYFKNQGVTKKPEA